MTVRCWCRPGPQFPRPLDSRRGLATTRATLIYQHRAAGRDQLIADAMGKLAEAELMGRRPNGHAAGTEPTVREDRGRPRYGPRHCPVSL